MVFRVALSLGAAALLVACVGDDPAVTERGGPVIEGGVSDVPCRPGAKDCVGSIPRTCDPSGRWYDEQPCSGLTPVCNAGICAAFKLRGGIGAVGFDHGTRACGATFCVTGGIVR